MTNYLFPLKKNFKRFKLASFDVETYGDDNLFLVHYHRDFDIRRKEIITEDDARKL